jgi:hypothetical protein
MYKARFENSKGQVFYFGYQHGNIFDIDGLTGQDLKIATSQGFNQIGETVESISIGSKNLEIKGRLLGEATQEKKHMLAVFAPFESGRLIFEDKYFIECSVKYTPLITPEKQDPRFELVLVAPYPYWQKLIAESHKVGGWQPKFSFPVNYAESHIFAIETTGAFINVYNAGQVEANYKMEFYAKGEVENPEVINVRTQEFVRLNTILQNGEKIVIERKNGKLIIEKEAEGIVSDAFDILDEDSDLLFMHVGDNVLKATALRNENLLVTTIIFNAAVVGVYEGI